MTRTQEPERERELVATIEALVKDHMAQYDPSHDWAHVERVRRSALKLAATLPGADVLVVELAALMHDLTDSKYASHASLPTIATEHLAPIIGPRAELVLRIIPAVSWSAEQKMRAAGTWGEWHDACPELHAVQDADRLDAIGAVGVLRCAAFSGVRGRYLIESGSGGGYGAEGHFYDKLLRIREFMKTDAGRTEAERRHKTMVDFLAALDAEREWA